MGGLCRSRLKQPRTAIFVGLDVHRAQIAYDAIFSTIGGWFQTSSRRNAALRVERRNWRRRRRALTVARDTHTSAETGIVA